MSNNMYRRKIDPMSRVTIPAEIREALGLQCGDDVMITHSDGVITVQQVRHRCIRCGSQKDLVGVGKGESPATRICAECIKSMHSVCRLLRLP